MASFLTTSLELHFNIYDALVLRNCTVNIIEHRSNSFASLRATCKQINEEVDAWFAFKKATTPLVQHRQYGGIFDPETTTFYGDVEQLYTCPESLFHFGWELSLKRSAQHIIRDISLDYEELGRPWPFSDLGKSLIVHYIETFASLKTLHLSIYPFPESQALLTSLEQMRTDRCLDDLQHISQALLTSLQPGLCKLDSTMVFDGRDGWRPMRPFREETRTLDEAPAGVSAVYGFEGGDKHIRGRTVTRRSDPGTE